MSNAKVVTKPSSVLRKLYKQLLVFSNLVYLFILILCQLEYVDKLLHTQFVHAELDSLVCTCTILTSLLDTVTSLLEEINQVMTMTMNGDDYGSIKLGMLQWQNLHEQSNKASTKWTLHSHISAPAKSIPGIGGHP